MCIGKMIDEMSDACYTMDNNQHCEVRMKNKQPPFQITNKIIDDVAEISELTGRLSAHDHLSSNPNLRRTNRIRTIHGSLAIEQNTLSLEQVTAVLNGKHVLAPPKDIAEVKNAYEIYERLDELDPYSVDDLLTAHGIMTRGLVEESGMFRTRPVGVVDQEGHVLHFGTLPQYVPDLVMELLDWAKHSDLHMLIRSCVFHYELELIHPFADGNGRVGRLCIRCCSPSGIPCFHGCRSSPSSTTISRNTTMPSTPATTQASPPCSSNSCSPPSKHRSSTLSIRAMQ